MIYEVKPDPKDLDPQRDLKKHEPRPPIEARRYAVRAAFEKTLQRLRVHLSDAMQNDQMLDQLYDAIQPDGTIHL